MTKNTTDPIVLIVEDERELADAFSMWLSEWYSTRTAYSGQEALNKIDDSVDIVLLDRRLPDIQGDEVLDRIQATGTDCRVCMVTAIQPDFDILGMGFDDYVVKPVFQDDLHRVVQQLLLRESYEDHVQELYAVASKLAVLETAKGPEELEDNEEYLRLKTKQQELRKKTTETLGEMNEFEDPLRNI